MTPTQERSYRAAMLKMAKRYRPETPDIGQLLEIIAAYVAPSAEPGGINPGGSRQMRRYAVAAPWSINSDAPWVLPDTSAMHAEDAFYAEIAADPAFAIFTDEAAPGHPMLAYRGQAYGPGDLPGYVVPSPVFAAEPPQVSEIRPWLEAAGWVVAA